VQHDKWLPYGATLRRLHFGVRVSAIDWICPDLNDLVFVLLNHGLFCVFIARYFVEVVFPIRTPIGAPIGCVDLEIICTASLGRGNEMLVCQEGGKLECLETNPWSKARINNKLNPQMTKFTENPAKWTQSIHLGHEQAMKLMIRKSIQFIWWINANPFPVT